MKSLIIRVIIALIFTGYALGTIKNHINSVSMAYNHVIDARMLKSGA